MTGNPPLQNAIGIIPARFASSRFPGKPLHPIAGKPLLQHVWERCRRCRELDRLVVATDDHRIADAARNFGAEVAMTSPEHPSGTDRVAEAARSLGDPKPHIVINIQGDEPLVDPDLVDRLARELKNHPDLPMVTAANPVSDPAEAADPDVVKVVTDLDGNALYFSRSPLPNTSRSPDHPHTLRHHGLYGYRLTFLDTFVTWPPSPLEKTEHLEQLRALENGARIRVITTPHPSIGVDTPEHAATVEHLLVNPHPTNHHPG